VQGDATDPRAACQRNPPRGGRC